MLSNQLQQATTVLTATPVNEQLTQTADTATKESLLQKSQTLLPQASSRSDLTSIPEHRMAENITDELVSRLMIENAKLTRRMNEIETKLTKRIDELTSEVGSKLSQRVDELEGGITVVIKDQLNLRQQIEAELKESLHRQDTDIVMLADAVQGLMSEFQICKTSLERRDVTTYQRAESPDKRNSALREQAGLALTAPVRVLATEEIEQAHTSPSRTSSSRKLSPTPRTRSKVAASIVEVVESEVASGFSWRMIGSGDGQRTKPCGPIVRKQDGAQVSSLVGKAEMRNSASPVTVTRILRQARTGTQTSSDALKHM